MKCSTITKTLTMSAVAVLTLVRAPIANATGKTCSNAILKGTFAHMANGFVTAPPAMAGPLAGAGTDTFDGNGGVTTTATLSLNGYIVPLTGTGRYKVNPDCTGTYTIQGPGGTTRLLFVIADSGN